MVHQRYVLCPEYESVATEEVPYSRSAPGAVKRPYGDFFMELFPGLRRVDGGFLAKDETASFDDVPWHVFERSQ